MSKTIYEVNELLVVVGFRIEEIPYMRSEQSDGCDPCDGRPYLLSKHFGISSYEGGGKEEKCPLYDICCELPNCNKTAKGDVEFYYYGFKQIDNKIDRKAFLECVELINEEIGEEEIIV